MRMLSWLRWMTAVFALLALVSTGAVFVGIYLEGNTPENMNEDGVYITPVYDRETVLARLSGISWLYAGWLLLCCVTGICQMLPQEKDNTSGTKRNRHVEMPPHTPSMPARRRSILQWGLLLAGGALLVHGICNGGLWDVLVKAINICTECIGLG